MPARRLPSESDILMKITVSTPVNDTPRTSMLRGLFDMPPSTTTSETWEPTFGPEIARAPWNVGLVTGPSGCGKSTIARHLWPNAQLLHTLFSPDEAIIDAFPTMPLRDLTAILSSVGFSSPPAWLRPYHVLSTGQQFRAAMAVSIALANPARPLLVDEYTSVIDRTVAKVGSVAIAKTIRERHLQFIAVSCHDDIIDWLQPDWIYLPAENLFARRLLRRRPNIQIKIVRCSTSAWPLFAPHHYLTDTINPAAQCWLATIDDRPAAFTSWLHYFGSGPPAKREHRTVCLPDFQGVGIGNALSSTLASMWTALGFLARSTTTHPGMIASRNRSHLWTLTRSPGLLGNKDKVAHATTRLTAGFKYIGPPMNTTIAKAMAK